MGTKLPGNNWGAESRRGTAATEFALCLPLLLLMALACADFGRIAYFHQIVCNAARTGAESGATHKFTDFTQATWEAGVEQAVVNEMENIPEFDAGDMGFALTATKDEDDMAVIQVSVSYPFRTVVAWPALPNEVVLEKSVEFHQFR